MHNKKPVQRILSLCLAIAIVLGIAIGTIVPAFAAPTKNMMVTDNGEMLTEQDEQEISEMLYSINQQTGIEFLVCTIKTLNGKDIETGANQLFRAIGLGDESKNNGLLLLIARDEHKFRLEVGYGLEGAIPDTAAAEIINTMTPYFKQSQYGTGVKVAVAKTVSTLNNSGDYTIDFDWDKMQEITKGQELTEGEKNFYNGFLKVVNCGIIGIIIFVVAVLGWQILLILKDLILDPVLEFFYQKRGDGKFRPLYKKKRQHKTKVTSKNRHSRNRNSSRDSYDYNDSYSSDSSWSSDSSSDGFWGGGSSGGGGASGGW